MSRAVGVAGWTDPGWRAGILDWASERLAEGGRRVTGPIEQPHVMPWSTVFRIPTDDGIVWCKASGPGTWHEAALLERLTAWGTPGVLRPLAVDTARAWMLLPDGGTRLRDLAADQRGDHDLETWVRRLPVYAALQRSLEDRAAELIAAGMPDERPERYPAMLASLLADEAVWARVDDADRVRTDAARDRLVALLPEVQAAASELARSGIPATLDHGDLHGGNILVGPDGVRFFDWGDVTISHPFATLTTTLGSIGYRTGLDLDGPELARVRDAYTEAWTDILPRRALAEVAGLALDLAHIGKASAFECALQGLEPDEMGGHHGATAYWLADLVERLDRRAGR